MSFDSTRAVRPRDAVQLIERCMSVARPVMLWGPPGVGKSELVASIAAKQNRPVIDMRLLLSDPTDLKGLPYYCPESKTMRWAQPGELPSETNGLENAVLFLDELNAAPPAVQASAYQLILNRRVGEYALPDGVSVICAGNRETDRGVTYRMPSPLANRLVHLEMAAHFDDWQQWAINNQVHADVVGFLSHHKHKLFNFDPKSPDKAFATPRSWVFVSQLLDDGFSEHLNTTLVAGTVGEGIATEFAAHRRVSAKMPPPEDVLKGRVTELKAKDLSAMYSMTISMCYTLKEWANVAQSDSTELDMDTWHQYVDNFFKFMMANFQPELIILGAKIAMSDYQLPIKHRKLTTFTEFYNKYGKFILE